MFHKWMEKSPFTSLLPKLASFIMGLVWIHSSNSSVWFYVLPPLKVKGEVTVLGLLRDQWDLRGSWVLVSPSHPGRVTFLNDLYCTPSKEVPHPTPPNAIGKRVFYPGTVTHNSAWEADFLNKISFHTSPIESPWEQETCCNPLSPSGTYSFAFLMKRYIVSVSVMHFLVGGRGTKR